MTRQKSGDTRGKLLAAATDVFAEKGFRDATVAEICQRVEANVSAVNYYFGSKEALYREAWRHAFAISMSAHPEDGGVSGDAPAEERLRGRIRALIARIADEGNQAFSIFQMEFANPTCLLGEVMNSALIPLREKTLGIVRELLGPGATGQQLRFCETCIISMCFQPMLIQRIRHRAECLQGPSAIDDIEAFTDHVASFALAGIAAIRAELAGTAKIADHAGSRPRQP